MEDLVRDRKAITYPYQFVETHCLKRLYICANLLKSLNNLKLYLLTRQKIMSEMIHYISITQF
ncbi:hypothetical protein CEN46_11970 [Fischerella thermalis CCMEE 5318]|uniref:Uncharacterized protein n=1 Tax=Fischerella thermalis CCMEE 5318 TaxID=2019666 RepID=A0A2N6LFT8_9CYAN|nr:hypothetical protein CEN47_23135 [Fischerella thermalis CCMEE 5319]PMB22574.1 hypothetical protein CEN46_11970 [Fischerella thermalis CCMEE 5318]